MVWTFVHRPNAVLLQMPEIDKRVLVDFGHNQANSAACMHNVFNSFYCILKTQRLTCLSGGAKKLENPWSDNLRCCDLTLENKTKRSTGNMNMHISAVKRLNGIFFI